MVSFCQFLFIALFTFSVPPASGLVDLDVRKVFEKETDFTCGEGSDAFRATVGASIGYILELKPSECGYTAMVDPGTLTIQSEPYEFTYGGIPYTFPAQDLSYPVVDSGFHYTSDGGVTLTLTRSLPVGWVMSRAGMSPTLELNIIFERTHPNACCFSEWKVSMELKFFVEVGPILLFEKSSDAVVVKNDLEIEHLATEMCSEAPTTAAPTTAAPTTAAPTTAAPTTAAPTTAAPTTVQASTTAAPTTAAPTTASPTTAAPSTAAPTSAAPTTAAPPVTWALDDQTMGCDANKIREPVDQVWNTGGMSYDGLLQLCKDKCINYFVGCTAFSLTSRRCFFYNNAECKQPGKPAWDFYVRGQEVRRLRGTVLV